MSRKSKHPNHKEEADRLMNELLDMVVQIWMTEPQQYLDKPEKSSEIESSKPQLKTIASETGLSPAKIRKLLITAGERDNTTYYESPVSSTILSLHHQGKSVKEIEELTGLSSSSIHGYLPHSKTVYSLDALSTDAGRIKLFRKRQKAVKELHEHIGLPDESEYLWRVVIAFEGFPFSTTDRGKDKKGAVRFKYTVSRTEGATRMDGADKSAGADKSTAVSTAGEYKFAGACVRHYNGTNVEGYGNEIFVDGKEKSISRSTVDLALKRAMGMRRDMEASRNAEVSGQLKGPKALGLPGSGSYLYPMLIRFGVIEK